MTQPESVTRLRLGLGTRDPTTEETRSLRNRKGDVKLSIVCAIMSFSVESIGNQIEQCSARAAVVNPTFKVRLDMTFEVDVSSS